jgi:hypothetical protein
MIIFLVWWVMGWFVCFIFFGFSLWGFVGYLMWNLLIVIVIHIVHFILFWVFSPIFICFCMELELFLFEFVGKFWGDGNFRDIDVWFFEFWIKL